MQRHDDRREMHCIFVVHVIPTVFCDLRASIAASLLGAPRNGCCCNLLVHCNSRVARLAQVIWQDTTITFGLPVVICASAEDSVWLVSPSAHFVQHDAVVQRLPVWVLSGMASCESRERARRLAVCMAGVMPSRVLTGRQERRGFRRHSPSCHWPRQCDSDLLGTIFDCILVAPPSFFRSIRRPMRFKRFATVDSGDVRVRTLQCSLFCSQHRLISPTYQRPHLATASPTEVLNVIAPSGRPLIRASPSSCPRQARRRILAIMAPRPRSFDARCG